MLLLAYVDVSVATKSAILYQLLLSVAKLFSPYHLCFRYLIVLQIRLKVVSLFAYIYVPRMT